MGKNKDGKRAKGKDKKKNTFKKYAAIFKAST